MSEQLVTIARYRDLPEALLAQGMLQAAGIRCELADENIVRLDWFWSNMVGGIRLQVDANEVEDAIDALASPIPPDLPGDLRPTNTTSRPAPSAAPLTFPPTPATSGSRPPSCGWFLCRSHFRGPGHGTAGIAARTG